MYSITTARAVLSCGWADREPQPPDEVPLSGHWELQLGPAVSVPQRTPPALRQRWSSDPAGRVGPRGSPHRAQRMTSPSTPTAASSSSRSTVPHGGHGCATMATETPRRGRTTLFAGPSLDPVATGSLHQPIAALRRSWCFAQRRTLGPVRLMHQTQERTLMPQSVRSGRCVYPPPLGGPLRPIKPMSGWPLPGVPLARGPIRRGLSASVRSRTRRPRGCYLTESLSLAPSRSSSGPFVKNEKLPSVSRTLSSMSRKLRMPCSRAAS